MVTTPALSTEQKRSLMIVAAVAEAIEKLGSVPSGHLYAQLMGVMDLEQYQAVIRMLERAKMIKVRGHLITWIKLD